MTLKALLPFQKKAVTYTCECNGGSTDDGFGCEYIDECATLKTQYLSNLECADTLRPDIGDDCHNVNECAENKDCSNNCQNTEGSFTCSCSAGFDDQDEDGYNCKQFNECKSEDVCNLNAE